MREGEKVDKTKENVPNDINEKRVEKVVKYKRKRRECEKVLKGNRECEKVFKCNRECEKVVK